MLYYYFLLKVSIVAKLQKMSMVLERLVNAYKLSSQIQLLTFLKRNLWCLQTTHWKKSFFCFLFYCLESLVIDSKKIEKSRSNFSYIINNSTQRLCSPYFRQKWSFFKSNIDQKLTIIIITSHRKRMSASSFNSFEIKLFII